MHILPRFLVLGAALAAGAFSIAPAVAQTYPANLDPNNVRTVPPNFLGSNGQERFVFDWETSVRGGHDGATLFSAIVPSLNLGILRFPDGTGANYWDWVNGTPNVAYYGKQFHNPSQDISELKSEILNMTTTPAANTPADPIFILNLLTNQPYQASNPLLSWTPYGGTQGTGPSPLYQLNPAAISSQDLLYNATVTEGLNLQYLELGNELYYTGGNNAPGKQSDNLYVYPTAADYGNTVANWIKLVSEDATALSNLGYATNFQCAAVGGHQASNAGPRQQGWTQGLYSSAFATTSYPNLQPNAVTLHIYPGPNIPDAPDPNTNGHIDATLAQDMFASPFNAQTTVSEDFDATHGVSQIPEGVPAWMTEYNFMAPGMKSGKYYAGTWAHGLSLGVMTLKWMEQSQLRIMVHHQVVGDSYFADIFSDDGFSLTGNNAISTEFVRYGLTAGGLVSSQINAAAKGQSAAQELSFGANAPSITSLVNGNNVTYPALLGWEFTGGPANQIVVVNLGANPYSVDLSGLMASGTYLQVSAPSDSLASPDPGVFVTDGSYGIAVDCNGVSANMVVVGATPLGNGLVSIPSLTSFTLPAFSLTRISCGGLTGAGLGGAEGTVTNTGAKGIWTLTGAGAGITGRSDQCYYASEQGWTSANDNSCTAIALLTGVSSANGSSGAKAGVMLRNVASDPSSMEADLAVTAAGKLVFQYRPSESANILTTTEVASISLPCWVKINRTGNVVKVFWCPQNQLTSSFAYPTSADFGVPGRSDSFTFTSKNWSTTPWMGLFATNADATVRPECTATFASAEFTTP